MVLMSNLPVPLGTLCIQCCWALSFCHSCWALFSPFDRRYSYPVGGRWAALTANYCVVVVVVVFVVVVVVVVALSAT